MHSMRSFRRIVSSWVFDARARAAMECADMRILPDWISRPIVCKRFCTFYAIDNLSFSFSLTLSLSLAFDQRFCSVIATDASQFCSLSRRTASNHSSTFVSIKMWVLCFSCSHILFSVCFTHTHKMHTSNMLMFRIPYIDVFFCTWDDNDETKNKTAVTRVASGSPCHIIIATAFFSSHFERKYRYDSIWLVDLWYVFVCIERHCVARSNV